MPVSGTPSQDRCHGGVDERVRRGAAGRHCNYSLPVLKDETGHRISGVAAGVTVLLRTVAAPHFLTARADLALS